MTSSDTSGNDAESRRILDTLRLVKDDSGTTNVLSFAALDSVAVRDGHAHVSLSVSRDDAGKIEPLRPRAEAAIAQLPGIDRATIVLTAHRAPGAPMPA
ncbi:iron-sulfur cluster assembly protein, partial [Acidomonas methanolica]